MSLSKGVYSKDDCGKKIKTHIIQDDPSKTDIIWWIKIYLQVKLPIDEDERGDAFRGIPKLSILVVLGFYLGVPWASPILGSCHSLFHIPWNLLPKTWKLHNTKLNRKSHKLVSARKKNHHIRYCNELILYLYWC